MARVLFYTGISLLLVSAALLYLPTCFSFIIIGILLAAFILSVIFAKKIHFSGIKTLLLITLAFAVFGTVVMQTRVLPAEKLSGYRAKVVATVSDWPVRYEDYSVYELKTESIKIIYKSGERRLKNVPQRLKLRVTDVNESNLSVFDHVVVDMTFQPLEKHRSTSLSSGVYAGGYTKTKMVCNGHNRPFYAFLYDLRTSINEVLYKNIEYDSAALISAVLLGDRGGLSESFESDARAAGVTHTLVVSGMHLGIIFQLLGYCLGAFSISKRVRACVLMAAIFALAAICGFTPSVLRAGLTYFILALGMFLYRRTDGLNSLGAAVIIILFFSPFGCGNIGFLLSALATFGLLYICPLFYDRICILLMHLNISNFVTKGLAYSICQTISATLATAPVCILCFGYLSLIAPIANLLIGFAITALLVLSIFVVVLLFVPVVGKAAASCGIVALVVICKYLFWIIGVCGRADWAILPADAKILIPWVLVMAAIVLAPLFGRFCKSNRSKWWLRGCSMALLSLAVGSYVLLATLIPTVRVTVLSVGNGCSVLLEYNNITYLIGAGDTESDAIVIERELMSRGYRKVDMLILPDLEKEMAGGAPSVIRRLKPREIVCSASGTYAEQLNHICGDSATLFEEWSTVSYSKEGYVELYQDEGVVIRTRFAAFVIPAGEKVESLLKTLSYKPLYLICLSQIPKDISLATPKQLILCGNEETVSSLMSTAPKNVLVFNNYNKQFVYKEFEYDK